MNANEYCLRCKTEKLSLLPESTHEISFYACQRCDWKFSKRVGKALTDAWLSPISLLLYGIIFEREPENKARFIAEMLVKQKTRDEIEWFIKETKRELENPTQRVSEIHNLVYQPSEEKVRKFLRLMVEHLEKELSS